MSGKFLNGIIAYGDINLKNGNINISNNSQIQSPNAGELKFVHANTTNGFTIKTVENASNDVYKLALGTTNGIDSYNYEFPTKNGIVALTSDIDTAIDDLKTDVLLKDSDTAQVILSDISFEGLVSVDNLAIEALTATSLNVTNDATFAGSINVKDIIATNSIKINDDNVALAKDIPDISNKADKATTLAGYGITDAVKTGSDAAVSKLTIFSGWPGQGVFEIFGNSDSSGIVLNASYQTANYLFDQGRFTGTQKVATLNDIPDVSLYITKDVSNLTNYETKTTAEGKYALASSLSSYALKSDISNVYKYIGSVDSYSTLPTGLTDSDAGKVYNIVNADTANNISAGDNVAWTGSAWDKLGGSVDLSNYIENGSDANLKSVSVSKSSSGKNLVLTAYDDNTTYLGLLDTLPSNENTIPSTLISFSEGAVGIVAPEVIQLNSEQLINIQTTVGGVSIIGADGIHLEHSNGNSVNTLDLTASSSAKLYSNKGITIQSDSIKLYGNSTNASRPTYNNSPLALTSDIPDVSSYITKDVSGLTNYETKETAEEKYAQKSTTLSGYGITDVYTKAEIDSKNVSFLTKESSGIQTISSDLALTGYVLIDNLAIDELNIESLTATSKVTLSGGLEVTGGLVADSIKVGDEDVALAKDIPDVSGKADKTEVDAALATKANDSDVVKLTGDQTIHGWKKFSHFIQILPSEGSQNGVNVFGFYNGDCGSSLDHPPGVFLGRDYPVWYLSFPYGKSGTFALLEDIPDVSSYITKDVSNLTNYETKETAEGKYAQKSTTLAGYGITNAYTKSEADSKFITKDVSNLTNYETKTIAEAKYALKEEIPEVPTSAKYEIPAKTPSANKIVWTITLDEEPDVAPIMQVFNKNGDVVYANITYVAGVITVVINSATACAEGDYYIIVSGQTGNNGYRTKVISAADFTQAAIDGTVDDYTIYYIV